MPNVSVIIPTFNRANLVGRSIKSVLDQTYCDFELIVVDDGSIDNTEEVVKAFSDPRIRYMKHEKNRGLSAARNTGIKAATGEYIAFQDSDDEWLPNRLERQLPAFQQDKEKRIGLVLCQMYFPEGNWTWAPKVQNITFEEIIHHEAIIGPVTFLIRRDVAGPELYFDENLRAAEDWDFLIRISRICDIEYIKEVLVHIHDDADSRNRTPINDLESRILLLQKFAEEFNSRPRALSSLHRKNALDYCALRKTKLTRQSLRAAIQASPRIPSLYLQYFLSLFGSRVLLYYLGLNKSVRTRFIRLKHGMAS